MIKRNNQKYKNVASKIKSFWKPVSIVPSKTVNEINMEFVNKILGGIEDQQ